MKKLCRAFIIVAFALVRAPLVNLVLRLSLKPLASILPKVLVLKLPVVGTIKVKLPNGNTVIFKSDGRDTIASRMYWLGLDSHEPETLNLFLHLLPHAKVIFDVGASTGIFSLTAGRMEPNLEIHAFEPVPAIFDSMVRNIEANSITNVQAIKACVTDFNGEIDLFPNQSPALPFQASVRENYRGETTPDRIHVEALTLDSYVSKIGVSTVDIIKIDAEVSEPEILKGSLSIIERFSPLIICEVLYTDTDRRLNGLLDDNVYQFFHIR